MSSLLTKLTADFETQLATAISVGGTTATLLSETDDDGNTIPDGNYVLTLERTSSNKEYIRCVKTGTSLTSIQSLSRQGALTTGCVRAHRIGSTVTITDWAQLKYLTDLLSGATDLDSTDPLKYDGTASITNDAHLATKKYVDDVAIAGAPDATNSVKGITKLSVAAASPTDPIAVGDNDTRVPTQGENDALAGTSGTPSSTNKYVTNDDTSATPSASKVVRYSASATLAATTATAINYQAFTASGTWTKPTGLTGNEMVVVQLWGAGGGGGGAAASNFNRGSGGGGGGYSEAKFKASDLGSTVTVTIGSGGNGGTGAADGSAGGNSTFGSLLTAYGGGGGGQGTGGSGGGGGGGGGTTSAGGNGTSGAAGAGGGVAGGAASGASSAFGGGGGGTQGSSTAGGGSGYGGGGGGDTATGGDSYYGGGGGGGGSTSGGPYAGGTAKVHGGNGGAGGNDASGTAGTAPGGGGGGGGNNNSTAKNGAAGARGECRVWVTYLAN